MQASFVAALPKPVWDLVQQISVHGAMDPPSPRLDHADPPNSYQITVISPDCTCFLPQCGFECSGMLGSFPALAFCACGALCHLLRQLVLQKMEMPLHLGNGRLPFG